MPKLSQVCHHVRSKNAGPFWITVDVFFKSNADFGRFATGPALSNAALAALYGAQPGSTKHVLVPQLRVLKFSYPRATPQGGVAERDMHGGQQYVRMLDLEL